MSIKSDVNLQRITTKYLNALHIDGPYWAVEVRVSMTRMGWNVICVDTDELNPLLPESYFEISARGVVKNDQGRLGRFCCNTESVIWDSGQ